jgi:hypothetical protein
MNKFLISGNPFIKNMVFYNSDKYIDISNIDEEISKINIYNNRSWNDFSVYSVDSWYQWLETQLI